MTTDPWTRQLVFALRLRRVRGDVIGDAVEVVVDHCRETGESAPEAFGTPEAYADELVASLPASAFVAATPAWSTVLVAVGAALGASLVLEAVFALASSEPASLPWSLLLVLLLTGAAALVVVRSFDRLVARPWLAGAQLLALMGGNVVLVALLGDTGVSMAPALGLVLGVAVLAATALLLVRSRALVADPVIDPVVDRAG